MYLVTVSAREGSTYSQRTVDPEYSIDLLMQCCWLDGESAPYCVEVKGV